METLLTRLTLAESLRKTAMSDKQITLVRGGEDCYSISYRDFYQQVLHMAAALQALGLEERSEMVIIISDNELFLKLFWACILAKIIVVPVAPGSQEQHKEKVWNILHQLGQPSIVAEESFYRDFDAYIKNNHSADAGRIKRIDIADLHIAGDSGIPMLPRIYEEDVAYIQYSSGSTGDPKGVVLTHANLLSNTRAIASRLAISAQDVALSWLPLTHDMGMICFHLTNVVAACDQVIMPTTLFIKRPLLWMELATRFKASILYSPNFGFQYLMKSMESGEQTIRWQLDHVRVIINGAEPISETITRRFVQLLRGHGLGEHTMFPGYGLAEASVAVTLPDVGHQLTFVYCKRQQLKTGERIIPGSADDGESLGFADCGYPVPDCQVRIADDEDVVLPAMFIGNIQVKGKNVTAGYYRQPDYSGLFTADGWLRTGDIGFLHHQNLVITGRKKNIIIVNGQNYYPHDIEQLTERELDIRPGSVVAVGVAAPQIAAQIVLFVLFKGSINTFFHQAIRIRELLAARMDIYPDYILPIRSIPKTTSGKVMHFRLKEALLNGSFDQEIATMQQMERDHENLANNEDVATVLTTVLKQVGIHGDIHPDESLFNAGLSSLKAMSLINALSRHQYDISFSMLYEAGTKRGLEALLQQRQKSNSTEQPIPKAPGETSYPLSWGQKQIYVAHMMAPDSANLNISFSVEMQGQLDESLLKEAFHLLILRHDVLRTAIQWKDNEPVQVLCPPEQVQPVWLNEDLTVLDYPETRLEEQKRLLARFPFNLEQAPLYRCCLLKTAPDKWVLIFSIHHIISDGWSIQLIGKEWEELYRMLKEGVAVPQPAPEKIQYKDFVFWQQQLQLTEKYRKNRLFWEQYLMGSATGVRIPPSVDRQTTEKGIAKGDVFKKYFPAEMTESVHGVARKQDVSVFSVLIAAIALLINKYNYTDREDMLIGIDTAGRTHPQLEDQIGYFLHALPVNIQPDATDNCAAFLKKLHHDLLLIYDHQTFNLEDINSAHRKATDFTTYNVLVIFQNFEEVLGFDTVFADLKAHTEEIENDTCLNDMLFEFSIDKGVLCLKVKYSTVLYDAAYVSGICDHLENILQQVCQHPAVPVDQVMMLSSEEREQVLHGFNDTHVDWALPDTDLMKIFECQVALRPDATALICEGKTISYGELDRRANQVAGIIAGLPGDSHDKLVGISTGRNEFLVVGILGVLKAGAAYVPIDPEYPAERIRYVLEHSRLALVLTDGSLHGCNDSIQTLSLIDIAATATATGYRDAVSPDQLAYVIYTSGSTGHPKGVMVSRRSLTNYIHAFGAYFNIGTADRVVLQSSIAFDTMVEEMFPVLFKGGVLVLSTAGGRDTDALADLIEKQQITVLSVTPLVLNELNNRLTFPGPLRAIISGGDELLPSHINHLFGKVPLFNTYGPTETTVCASYFPVTDITKTHFIGKPIANTQVYILDHALHAQPVNVPGEICIAGEGVALGYLNNLSLTNERFVANPYGQGLLYRTGDIGRWDHAGNVEFLGRRDTQVKVRGYRIELGEIEKCLLGSGLVDQVVADVFLNSNEKTLVAYYTGDDDAAVVLREYLHARLPYYMVPAFFVRLTQLPLTPNGKINRKLLPPPEAGPRVYHPPQTETEKALAHLWENILQHPRISMNDNFFEIGGQSLKAIQVISKVFKDFSVKLELRDLFANPVLAQFTERVEIMMWLNAPAKPDLTNNVDEIII